MEITLLAMYIIDKSLSTLNKSNRNLMLLREIKMTEFVNIYNSKKFVKQNSIFLSILLKKRYAPIEKKHIRGN